MNATSSKAKPPANPQRGVALDSRQLFPPGENTVLIEHGGQRYTLRLTRENKLILTK